MLRSLRARVAQCARRQDGAAAVEFALVATPFLALLFAIIETALVFFAGQSLEASVADSGRLVMTGQAQSTDYKTGAASGTGWSREDFKKAVCARTSGLFDCSKLIVSVKTAADFDSADTSTPIKDGKLTVDADNPPYDLGGPGSIEVVQVYYKWPIYVSLLSDNLSNLGGDRLLVATSVFVNEPYQ
jgi:Flp pilus assembly protein TadG